MQEIKCPNCGQVFKIDESNYDSIVRQIRNHEFDKEVKEKLDAAISLEKKDAELLLSDKMNEKDQIIASLKQEIEASKNNETQKIENAISKQKDIIAQKEIEITKLKGDLSLKENNLNKEKEQALADKDKEILQLNSKLEMKNQEFEIKENGIRTEYETLLKRTGAMGIVHSSDVHIQVIYGPKVESIAANVREVLKSDCTEDEKEDNSQTEPFCSPMSGTMIPMEQVPDPAFSEKMMGDGFAIEPKDGIVQAPFDGSVEMIFPTGHAIGVKSHDGMEVLIHLGIDTVDMKGEGFEVLVKQGDRVKQGDILIKVDLDAVKKAGKKSITPIIFTSGEKIELLRSGKEKKE